MEYGIIRVVKGLGGTQRTLRLVITGVPEKTTRAAVAEALTAAGKAGEYSEGGIPFGNHDIHARAKAGWPRGTAGADTAPVTTWAELTAGADSPVKRRITLSFTAPDYEAIALAAQRHRMSLQGWCAQQLLTATTTDKP